MGESFITLSKSIVNEFLRDIVFIDECAYPTKESNEEQKTVKVNEFNAQDVSAAFCKAGKICAIYAPQFDIDIEVCVQALKKADAIVLDWDLKLKETKDFDPMEDVVEDEGKYTKQIIKNILEDAGNEKIKLIIIYTGELNLPDICKQVSQISQKLELNTTELVCQQKNVRILVRAKETTQYNHAEHLKNKIVAYEDLPQLINDEFAKLTTGLLSNYALNAITAIRNNTSNILGVFSQDLDAAFLGHYVSVDNSDDAVLMLAELFGSAISDLIKEDDIDMTSWITSWINCFAFETRNISLEKKKITINSSCLNNIISEKTGELYVKLNKNGFDFSKGKKDKYKSEAIKLFSSEVNTDIQNYKFAHLIQHKNIFSTAKTVHRLSTGTIVKYTHNDEEEYFLCIQQSCDSTRIQSERNFLFLPLLQDSRGEAIVINHDKHLFVENKSYAVQVFTFATKNSETQITSEIRDGKCVFIDSQNTLFEWVAELKDLFAQHIVSQYAANLSRVGLNNSEWMRLMGKDL